VVKYSAPVMGGTAAAILSNVLSPEGTVGLAPFSQCWEARTGRSRSASRSPANTTAPEAGSLRSRQCPDSAVRARAPCKGLLEPSAPFASNANASPMSASVSEPCGVRTGAGIMTGGADMYQLRTRGQ